MTSTAAPVVSDRHWPQALRLIGGVWTLGLLLMMAGGLAEPDLFSPREAVRWTALAALGVTLCAGAWRLAIAIPEGRRPGRVVVLGLVLSLAWALHVAADVQTAGWLHPGEAPQGQVVSDNPLFALTMRLVITTNAVLYLALYGFFGMGATGLISVIETRERDRRLAEALAAASRAQLAALRFQLNPHFLFNTLNAIGSLVVTMRAKEAEAMIGKLSDFLRASLAADAEPFTPLEDELAVTQAYLDIEAERFRDRMRVVWDCPPELLRAMAPSFLLQPLVENAVKYAVSPALRPVTLRVAASREGEDLVLSVEDDGAGEVQAGPRPPGIGVGLNNVRERLALLYGPRAVLDAGANGEGFRAAVRFPLTWAERAAA
ncbi:histidine kinase [Caulobacter sp. 17J65-9]|uniref:histidine kinase n=1 Tax=Caulobacter sp. 17J65-9 TaxID=2709382 RepID=UPI0013C71996|nr:hypothetical protein [Caulobacter sp. 17J65-9]